MTEALKTRIENQLDELVAALDEHDPSGDPTAFIALLARHRHRIAAIESRCAHQAAEAQRWRREGYRSADDWLARTTGSSSRDAKRRLATADRLSELPTVRAAAERGDLSPDQTFEVARGAAADPTKVRHLLGVARRCDLHRLRESASEAVAQADPDPENTRRRIHRKRAMRTWVDAEGAWHLSLKGTTLDGAICESRIDNIADRIFRAAYRTGVREPREAYRFDAAVLLLTGRQPDFITGRQPQEPWTAPAASEDSAPDARSAYANTKSDPRAAISTTPPKRDVLIHIDFAALLRGRVLSGERCHIAGVGSVPIEIAADLEANPFIKAVIRDGTEIKSVAHFGRHIPAELRTAIEANCDRCENPGCGSTFFLEVDHLLEYAKGGPTAYANLDRLCSHCHNLKTTQGYRLLGPPGHRQWRRPDGSLIRGPACDDAECDWCDANADP